MAGSIRGTQGYADEAGELLTRYEQFSFDELHPHVRHLLPEVPGLAHDAGLRVLLNRHGPSLREANHCAGVSWTRLAFERPGDL